MSLPYIYTDNNPLKYLHTAKLAAVEQRWASQLASFKFNIVYRSGKSNVCADALSRQTHGDTESATSTDVQEILCSKACSSSLPTPTQVVATQSHITMDTNDSTDTYPKSTADPTLLLPSYSRPELIELQQRDPTICSFLHFWRQAKKPTTAEKKALTPAVQTLLKQWPRVSEIDGLLYRTVIDQRECELAQLILPECLKEKVLSSLHNEMGHQGLERTTLLARSRFYWPGMHSDIEDWIKKCERCVLAKMPQPRIRAPMGHLTASQPLELLAIDFTLLEPSSDGRENVLVMTDVFTKFSLAIPTRDQKATTVARVLVKEWFQKY